MRRLHTTEHAILDSGGTIGIGEHRARCDAEISKDFAQQAAVAIGADNAERGNFGAQCAQIRHHETRVAGPFFTALHAQNGDRRFGRDARNIAPGVTIENHFARDHHAQRLERRQIGRRAIRGKG